MTLRYQGADPDQWLDESPNGSRLPVSTVSAAGRPTPGPCGMGLTPVLGSSATASCWPHPGHGREVSDESR